ncbi:MAG: glutaredoxin family protein [Firmicutes bacterium]|nr:glutaredoxin family protein [Bacillota bacterium]
MRDSLTRRGTAYDYHDVKKDQDALLKMLKLTGGARKVPVIVQGGEVTIGFGGT